MNKAYDKNGNPVNLVCFDFSNFERELYFVEFNSLPDVKTHYFEFGDTWVLSYGMGKTRAELEAPMYTDSKTSWVVKSKCEFSSLPPKFQSFVMRYYEDTFGLPGEGGI